MQVGSLTSSAISTSGVKFWAEGPVYKAMLANTHMRYVDKLREVPPQRGILT